jgi:hypothetical protein
VAEAAAAEAEVEKKSKEQEQSTCLISMLNLLSIFIANADTHNF